MSNDGAHLNIGAQDAMEAVIAGLKPKRQRSADEFRTMVLTAEKTGDPGVEYSYEGCANWAAKCIWEAFLTDPSLVAKDADAALEDWIRAHHPEVLEGQYGVTGFQWGWAVNTARYLCELPPVPNPAIIELEA